MDDCNKVLIFDYQVLNSYLWKFIPIHPAENIVYIS